MRSDRDVLVLLAAAARTAVNSGTMSYGHRTRLERHVQAAEQHLKVCAEWSVKFPQPTSVDRIVNEQEQPQ